MILILGCSLRASSSHLQARQTLSHTARQEDLALKKRERDRAARVLEALRQKKRLRDEIELRKREREAVVRELRDLETSHEEQAALRRQLTGKAVVR